MELLEILKCSEGYAGQNRNIPPEWKARAQKLCWEYNQTAPDQGERRAAILQELLGTCHPLTFIEPSFHCDYGFNIHTHGLAVINYNCVILDTSPVHIPKAGHEAGQGSLTGAGGSHDGCGCPFRDGKAHIINDFPVSVREIHMVKYNVMAFGRLNRAALVYSWRLVNFLYPINRGINHRQHKEHLAGRLQLAIYQKSGNYHHQAGKKGHTALKEKPN